MQMLGWEATLGASLALCLLFVALLLPGEDAGHLENMLHASLQMLNSTTVLFSVLQHSSMFPSSQQPTRRPTAHPQARGPSEAKEEGPLSPGRPRTGRCGACRSSACPMSPSSAISGPLRY